MELLQAKNLNEIYRTDFKAGDFCSSATNAEIKVLVLFGTRPEAIKLAPVVYKLQKESFQTIVVSSGQHKELLAPFLKIFNLKTDYDLQVMSENQTPNQVLSKTLHALDEVLEAEKPNLILVQGDTTTTLAGALAGFTRQIAVAHVEAGLRSGNLQSPFPEEMNRRLVSQVAAFHFAATAQNRDNLLAENVPENRVFITGNTIIDALHFILEGLKPSEKIKNLIAQTKNLKRILLTTHRRESFGEMMSGNLRVLREFVERREDACLIFPVHPNPSVRSATERILAGRGRIFLLEPLDYFDFVYLMKAAWLIVSDSGGVQEEAPSLGKAVLVLRENTERLEAIEAGTAKLVGRDEKNLAKMLEENYNDEAWINSLHSIKNPFGDGKSAKRIVGILAEKFNARTQEREQAKKGIRS